MKSKKIHNIFISASENVAWLLNIRGKDNPNSPIPNCKIILTNTKKIFFFSCPKKINIIKKHSKKLIIVYCQKGIRSEQAVNTLIKLGLDNVVSIEGGINAWIKEQLPIANK